MFYVGETSNKSKASPVITCTPLAAVKYQFINLTSFLKMTETNPVHYLLIISNNIWNHIH